MVVEKVSHLCILHDHVDILSVIKCVPDLDDMWVINFGVEFDLPLHKFDFGLGRQVSQTNLDDKRGTILRAYMRLVLLWRANRTVPKEPLPSFLSYMKENYSID